MKKPFYFLLICTFFVLSCKSKKKIDPDEDTNFFPVLSFIKSQVSHVDTSLYKIIKIVREGSTADTTYIKREEFREVANDFLSIPDITSDKLKDDYTETRLYDEDLKQVVLNYMPKKPDKEITRQEVMINPDSEGDKVKSIFIDRVTNNKNSTTHKILFWQVDKRFRIVTLTKSPDGPEKKETIEVVWNDFPS
jgi:hypothetical protein